MKAILLTICMGMLACFSAHAQIGLTLKGTKKSYIEGEAITMDITIANHMGKAIELKNVGRQPWLDINIMRTEHNQLLPQAHLANFPALTLAAGKQTSRRIDMRVLYDLNRSGYYYAVAYLRSPDGKNVFTSQKVYFSIQQGRQLWSHTIASSNGQRYNYAVLSHAEQEMKQMFVQVKNFDSGMPINTIPLGPWLSSHKPICSIDSKLNLHVLFPCTPKYYTYGSVDIKGTRIGFSHYRVVPGVIPRLVPMPDGSVKVQGAVYVDPKAPPPKLRDATDVPT